MFEVDVGLVDRVVKFCMTELKFRINCECHYLVSASQANAASIVTYLGRLSECGACAYVRAFKNWF